MASSVALPSFRLVYTSSSVRLHLLLFILTLCAHHHHSHQSIFSSILRNNLNRYLKNPLFTKSVAPGWPNEAFEYGSGGGGGGRDTLVSPQGSQITEFIKSQNKFTNEHLMETYGTNFNFDALLPEAFPPGLNSGGGIANMPTPAALSAAPTNTKTYSKLLPPHHEHQVAPVKHHSQRSIFNATKHFLDDKSAGGRQNSKSLTVSSSNTNAYSDTSKLQQLISGNKNSNLYSSKANSSNLYVDTPSSGVRVASEATSKRHHTSTNTDHSADNFENNLRSGNKYNQEKALNLKLEYGFRPLPAQSKPSTSNDNGDGDFRTKDFTVTNSIQMNDPYVDFAKSVEEELEQKNKASSVSISLDGHKKGHEDEMDEEDGDVTRGNNIYSNLEAVGTSNDKDDDDEAESERMRSMKSLAFEALNNAANLAISNHHQNHQLDDHHQFAPDYKKYISYPMETESSDIHKLAFTGVESFKPEHGSYVEHIHHGMDGGRGHNSFGISGDSLEGYPNIKHFKSQGIDCARNSGYCEYDSSYPKEHVNSIVSNCSHLIEDMYIEMPENLADFSGYKSFIEVGRSHLRSSTANNSLCDAERKYIRPSVIQDVDGHFYLILQSSFYFQQVPVEICSAPGLSCNVVGRCNAQVKCVQKYRTHMLISIDTDWPPTTTSDQAKQSHSSHLYHNSDSGRYGEKKEKKSSSASTRRPRCPRMRMYRLPSSCVCELSRP